MKTAPWTEEFCKLFHPICKASTRHCRQDSLMCDSARDFTFEWSRELEQQANYSVGLQNSRRLVQCLVFHSITKITDPWNTEAITRAKKEDKETTRKYSILQTYETCLSPVIYRLSTLYDRVWEDEIFPSNSDMSSATKKGGKSMYAYCWGIKLIEVPTKISGVLYQTFFEAQLDNDLLCRENSLN